MAYWTTYISQIHNNTPMLFTVTSGENKFPTFEVLPNTSWSGEIIIPWVDAPDQTGKAMSLYSRKDAFGSGHPVALYIFQYNPNNQLRWSHGWGSGDPLRDSQELKEDSGVGNSRILTIDTESNYAKIYVVRQP